jgi:hypothetical protein
MASVLPPASGRRPIGGPQCGPYSPARFTIVTDPQRYVCIELLRRYRCESRDSDFMRDIEVDVDGIVVEYPGLFRCLL